MTETTRRRAWESKHVQPCVSDEFDAGLHDKNLHISYTHSFMYYNDVWKIIIHARSVPIRVYCTPWICVSDAPGGDGSIKRIMYYYAFTYASARCVCRRIIETKSRRKFHTRVGLAHTYSQPPPPPCACERITARAARCSVQYARFFAIYVQNYYYIRFNFGVKEFSLSHSFLFLFFNHRGSDVCCNNNNTGGNFFTAAGARSPYTVYVII